MSFRIFGQLLALLTALTTTMVAIFWLKSDHINAFWTSLGMDFSGRRLNWCEERVNSLTFYAFKGKILERDGKWLWIEDGIESQIDYLRVEKWFARYCQVTLDQAHISFIGEETPIFEAKFIDGQRLSLYSNGKNLFRIRDQIFQSDTFQQAIKELLALGGKIE